MAGQVLLHGTGLIRQPLVDRADLTRQLLIDRSDLIRGGDRPREVLAKLAEWLEAGVGLVWVLDPELLEGRVYRRDGSLTLLGRDDSLEGEDVLPGFRCRLGDLLEYPNRPPAASRCAPR